MFKHPFSFKGRIRRTEYWLSLIILFVLAGIIRLISDSLTYAGNEVLAFFVPLVGLFIFYWLLFALNTKRCHDRDNSGLWQIIPFYWLWLLFGDGDAFENDYGPDPKGRDILDDN